MLQLRACIDVSDVAKAVAFYTQAFGLRVARKFGDSWVELEGGPVPIDLLHKPAGSAPSPNAVTARDYARHWTPLHLDFVVENLDEAVARAQHAGAVLEQDIQAQKWGRMANLADPFGHGFCLLEFNERGYDALLAPT